MATSKTALLFYSLIAALLFLLAFPALAWLAKSWMSNPYYSHGFLVPVIAALLAWREWKHVVAQPRGSENWMGLIVAVPSLIVIIWAMRWQNYFVVSLALVALLVGILLYLEGWRRVRHWIFPVLFLAFMVPLPFVDLASPWLEAFTARFATALATLAGIPAIQQGGEITLPGSTIVVGAPCSGLRSLIAMVTVGAGWVYVVQGRAWAKALMLVAVIPLVALSNVVRIAILLAVADLFGEEAALSYYHDWSSPVLFLVALGLLLVVGRILGCSRIRDDLF